MLVRRAALRGAGHDIRSGAFERGWPVGSQKPHKWSVCVPSRLGERAGWYFRVYVLAFAFWGRESSTSFWGGGAATVVLTNTLL